MGTEGTPETSPITVSDETIHALIKDQFPDLGTLEIGRRYIVADHISVRLGDSLGIRVPIVPGVGNRFLNTYPWIGPLVGKWSFRASVPIRIGEPTGYYPYYWDIVNWYSASNAGVVPLNATSAVPLMKALREVYQAAPPEAPDSDTTGKRLVDFDGEFRALCKNLLTTQGPRGESVHLDEAHNVWRDAINAEIDDSRMWTHGWVGPYSVLSDRGRFQGLCNWHFLGAGDRAADIGAALALIPAESHRAAMRAYGRVSAATRRRVAGYRLLDVLAYMASTDPFQHRYGWLRGRDYGLVDAEEDLAGAVR